MRNLTHNRESRKWLESLIELMLLFSGLISSLVMLAIFVFLVYFTMPIIARGDLLNLMSWNWRPLAGQYGILPMAIGSLFLAVSATLAAYPLGLGICCFIHSLGLRSVARFVLVIIDFMTSVPTVVYGFVSAFLLVPTLRQCFEHGTGFSWFAASVTLTVLVLPTIVLVIHTQLRQLGSESRLTAIALGISPAQTLLWVILPQASRGLVAAALLGFGRALGDTIVSLMVAGNAPQVPHSILDSIRTLTAHIALVVATDVHSATYHSLFLSGLILVTISAMVNASIRWIAGKSGAG
ncbi:MAG: ABC transporter permease subunit [Desulfomonile sp.]|nr:ABC transporter permease subunit [Desulfomonile sp.]